MTPLGPLQNRLKYNQISATLKFVYKFKSVYISLSVRICLLNIKTYTKNLHVVIAYEKKRS